MTDTSVYAFNRADNTFTAVVAAMPAENESTPLMLAHWNAIPRGGVDRRPYGQLQAYSIPINQSDRELIGASEAIAHVDWPDGTQSVIVLERDADIARLCDAFGTTDVIANGLGITFDAEGAPYVAE